MKVALIGRGRWGQVLLKELKEQIEVKYECGRKDDLSMVWSDPEIKAVFIAVPTEVHFKVASDALDAGKHVFLEKPGTTESKLLEILVYSAEKKGLKFAVGYEFPHDNSLKKLKEILSNEKVISAFFEWNKWGSFNDDVVRHLLCHDVSVAFYLGLSSKLVSLIKTRVITDTDILEAEFDGGVRSFINRVSTLKRKALTVVTEFGGYVWENGNLFRINKEAQSVEKLETSGATSVASEIRDFISSIQENREPAMNGRFALEVYRILERF